MNFALLKKWKSETSQNWLKIFSISILATVIFTSLSFILENDHLPQPQIIPPSWLKIQLTLRGHYLAEEGETVAILETNGSVLIDHALLLKITRNETNLTESSMNNLWNVEIAIAPIDHQKLKILNSKTPDQLYISPAVHNVKRKIEKIIRKHYAYEMSY